MNKHAIPSYGLPIEKEKPKLIHNHKKGPVYFDPTNCAHLNLINLWWRTTGNINKNRKEKKHDEENSEPATAATCLHPKTPIQDMGCSELRPWCPNSQVWDGERQKKYSHTREDDKIDDSLFKVDTVI